MKKTLLVALVLLVTFSTFSQNDDKARASFVEGSQLMEEFNFSGALPIWLDLLKNDPDNANLNYKAGYCYLKLSEGRKQALPYLKKAVLSTTSNYDPFAPAEKSAPIESYFYIGEAHHLNYEMDKAIEYYREFQTLISEGHEFYKKVEIQINSCQLAKDAVANPVDVRVRNLGAGINTKYQEYSPVLSVDESTLYFTTRRLNSDSSNIYLRDVFDGMYYEDIYVSYKNDDYKWGPAEPIKNINTSNHEATLNLSSDGQTLFIYKTNKTLNGDIYESTFDGTNWTTPTPLGSDINSEYQESHAAITPDGQQLYFISNRKGSTKFTDKCCDHIESKDIYFCNKLPTGEWAKAQRLEGGINTPWNEDGVFIHPDGKTMYFSSQGHETIGGFDIFYSEKDDNGKWGKPVNLGYPINSTDNDVFFVTSADGKRGYFSSIQESGYGEKDIYMISMVGLTEKPLTLLIGQIIASDNSEVPNDIQIYVTDNETKEEIGVYKPRSRDHKFTIIIPPGSDYHLAYESGERIFFEDDIFVPEESAYQEIKKAIDLKPINFEELKKADNKPTSELTLAESTPKKAEPVAVKKAVSEPAKPAVEAAKPVSTPKETTAPATLTEKKEKATPASEAVAMKAEKKTTTTPKVTAPSKVTKPSSAPSRPAYKTEVEEIDGEKYIIHNVVKGNTLFDISLMYNTKLSRIQSDNPWAGDLLYEGDKVKVAIPANAKFFQQFFDYNIADIESSAQDFQNFVNEVSTIIGSKGKATISIESSASKVPTTKHGTNKNLTAKRGELAKEALKKALTSKNIDVNKVYFATMSTLVRGPAYQNDASANKAEYKKYQYVKIIVK